MKHAKSTQGLYLVSPKGRSREFEWVALALSALCSILERERYRTLIVRIILVVNLRSSVLEFGRPHVTE